MPVSVRPGRGRLEHEVGFVLVDIQTPPDQSLDRSQVFEFLAITEREGNPGRAGPGRAPDPVNICLGDVGHIEIDDVRDLVDVDPARSNVGGDEHRRPA